MLGLVGLAVLLLIASGLVATGLASDPRGAPARQADRALTVLAAGPVSALLCVVAAVAHAAAVWGYDASVVRIALERADPVRILGQSVPSTPGSDEWIAIGALFAWIVVAAGLWARDFRRESSLRRILRDSPTTRATATFLRRKAVRTALERWGADAPALVVVDVDQRIGPVTWGLRRRTIGLPTTSWDDGVLVHELAHVVRGDGLRTAVLRFASHVAWFAPVVQTAVQRVRFLIELAVDDMVVHGGVDRLDYADTLLAHARRDARATPGLALASAANSALGCRVSRLAGVREYRVPGSGGRCWWFGVLVLAGLVVAGLADHEHGAEWPGCAVGTERVTAWRHLDPDGMSAGFRWWGDDCQGTLHVRGPLLVTSGGQLMLPAESDAHFRFVVDTRTERHEYDLRDGPGAESWALDRGVLVATQPALGEVLTFLFRETGWDGGTWTREVARTTGVDGLLLQSRLAHDPTVKAQLVTQAVAEARVASFVDLLRDAEPRHRSSILEEVAGNDRRSVERREVIEAALAMPKLHFD